MAAERDLLAKELADLRTATQVVINMVEDGEAGNKTLVERLREAPQKITSFLSDTSKQYLAHALRLVKSFWPAANLALIGDGVVVGCSGEKFSKYVEEMKPIADKVIIGLEPSSEEEA